MHYTIRQVWVWLQIMYCTFMLRSALSSLSVTQAYLDGLAGFVDAVGIKKPFAVVVQVRHL